MEVCERMVIFMKFFILGRKGFLFGLLLYIMTIVAVVGFGTVNVSQVSSSQVKELPIYSVAREDNAVSMGINCAWGDEDIIAMLDILDAHDVKATFFLVGEWAEKYPEKVMEIYKRGHEIGTHSQSHPDMATLSKEEIITELDSSAKAVEAVTGKTPILFRPPSGSYNNLLISTAREKGYYTIQWNRDSLDWMDKTAEEIVGLCTNELQSGDIMLLHAGAKNTLEALPLLLEKTKEKGYNILAVGELIFLGEYSLDHEGRQHSK